jgi:prepilin-type N-terminal cleavage/methylation domain-containing protein
MLNILGGTYMSLTNIRNLQKEKGFTIVELLIVIVVIAILAAIVLVAYNGIQNSARDTQNQTDAVSLVKVAEAVNADSGAYPTGATQALLTASFDSTDTTQIPEGVAVTPVTDPPTNAAAITAADSTRTYSVETCAGGVTVYYPSRSAGVIQTAVAGEGCA